MARSLLYLAASLLAYGQTFYAFGISGYADVQPHPAGWAAVAHCVNTTQQIWSFSETDYVPVRVGRQWQIQSSVRTGVATYMRKFGSAGLYALADGGAATTGTGSSGAFSTGGFLLVPLRGHWYQIVGARYVRTATTVVTLIEVGVGHD